MLPATNIIRTYQIIKGRLKEKNIGVNVLAKELKVGRQHLYRVMIQERLSYRIAYYICHRLDLSYSIFPYLKKRIEEGKSIKIIASSGEGIIRGGGEVCRDSTITEKERKSFKKKLGEEK
jgi:hypothetical protein